MSQYSDYNVQDSQIGIMNTSDPDRELMRSFSGVLVKKSPGGMNGSLFALLDMKDKQAKTIRTINPYYYTEKLHFPAICATADLPATAVGANSTILTDQVEGIIPNQFLHNETTGEQMLVISVPTSTSVIVQRGIGDTAPAVITTDDRLTMIGTAFEESSLRPIPVTTKRQRVDNVTEIFRNTWALSDTEGEVHREQSPQSRAKNFGEGAWQHARDIETSLWFSQRYEGMRNGQPLRKLSGLDAQIRAFAPQNVFNAGPTTSYTQLEYMLDSTKQTAVSPEYIGQDYLVMVGTAGLRVLNQIGRGAGQVFNSTMGSTSFGFRFTTVTTMQGTYHFMHNRLFDTNPYWAKRAYIVNLAAMDVMYLGDRKSQHRGFNRDTSGKLTTVVDNGVDAHGGTFTSELTLQCYAPETCAIIENLTQGVCDSICDITPEAAADYYPAIDGDQPNLYDPSETTIP